MNKSKHWRSKPALHAYARDGKWLLPFVTHRIVSPLELVCKIAYHKGYGTVTFHEEAE